MSLLCSETLIDFAGLICSIVLCLRLASVFAAVVANKDLG